MNSQCLDGGTLNAFDDFNRVRPSIEVDFPLPAERVVHSLNQIIAWRRKPKAIPVDNGPEYVSGKLMVWVEKRDVRLEHIQPGLQDHPCRGSATVEGCFIGAAGPDAQAVLPESHFEQSDNRSTRTSRPSAMRRLC